MKVLNKILDNYYTDKLIEQLRLESLMYRVNLKFVKDNSDLDVFIKMREFNDEQYALIMVVRKQDSINHLINFKKMRKHFNENIEKYIERTGRW